MISNFLPIRPPPSTIIYNPSKIPYFKKLKGWLDQGTPTIKNKLNTKN